VYAVVTVTLLSQIDASLTQVSQDLIQRLRLNSVNQFDTRGLADFRVSENIAIQLWGNNQQPQYNRDAGKPPLNENGLLLGRVVFDTINQPNRAPMRVLSVPLSGTRGPAGVLQIGLSMRQAETAVSTLATTLVALSILAILFTLLTVWITTRRALMPLETMTRVATQITRADDLQRRIPLTGDEKDEVGQVVLAFNATMERLEKLFNTQRRFLADVSHELRTPLTVIKGNASLIRKLGSVDEESLNGIETEVDRLARLVGDLLLLAQAESGKVPMIMKPVELDTLLLEVFQQMRMLAGDRLQIKILEIDQLMVVADRDRLKQVLVNLVANAIQYTPAGG
ncbi:HAMP domain-containing protein, partial [bacterium]|nr:HAMP domain-containing protein [bacterium]